MKPSPTYWLSLISPLRSSKIRLSTMCHKKTRLLSKSLSSSVRCKKSAGKRSSNKSMLNLATNCCREISCYQYLNRSWKRNNKSKSSSRRIASITAMTKRLTTRKLQHKINSSYNTNRQLLKLNSSTSSTKIDRLKSRRTSIAWESLMCRMTQSSRL